ncbi:hypothetical protein SPF06_17605 [Sinomonas sp. JGH33]|uniref:Uncharacterized protein n=1 Tax=Sinomonas terricola TaxID=3110330 RepID=A0ABU5TBS8_9MICC|nr:hypothetical protein [Sinomonas sp. JGH33]MEA5456546.1 hypothetical protein [Sinomonas sp. JGH33]
MNPKAILASIFTPWTAARCPGPADTRHIIGSWAARSLLLYFVIERVAAVAWVDPTKPPPSNYVTYDYAQYFISDLGARGCQPRDTGSIYARNICSPLFPVMDLSLIFLGIGIVIAAALITSTVLRVGGHHERFREATARPVGDGAGGVSELRSIGRHVLGEHFGHRVGWRHHLTNATRCFMGLAGVSLVGVGAFPEDYNTPMHVYSTEAFLACSVLTVLFVAVLWWTPRPVVSLAMIVSAGWATYGGAMLLALSWGWLDPNHAYPRGWFERCVVYGFIVGMSILGLTLGSGAKAERRARRAGRHAHVATAPDGNLVLFSSGEGEGSEPASETGSPPAPLPVPVLEGSDARGV